MSDFIAIGAGLIAMACAYYASRQANAAEAANDLTKEANRLTREANARAKAADKRALGAAKAMAWRWQTIPNGQDRYLLVNSGMNTAYGVAVKLPDFMDGHQLYVETMAPLEAYQFRASLKQGYVAAAPNISSQAIVEWHAKKSMEDSAMSHNTNLPSQT